jgi:4-hydroxy-tetrahydrodipicolinate reductase
MSAIRIVFSGAKGRMGQALLPGLQSAPGLEVVGETDQGDDLLAAVKAAQADVVVDFTAPSAAVSNARLILAAGVNGVIGTTGFSAADLDRLDVEASAARRCLLVAPNFSLGMILLQRFSEEAVRWFPRVEITETHHEAKLDAPSGTALRTAERLALAGAEAGPVGEFPSRGLSVGGVQVHSRRLPGIHAKQEVHLAGAHEALTLTHEALSRDCYLEGVIAGVRAVPHRVGLLRGLDEILFDSR